MTYNGQYKPVKKHKKTGNNMFLVFGMGKLIAALVVIILIAIAVIALIIAINASKKPKGPGPQEVDTVSTLEKVVKKSSLSTYEVVYNGVVTVYNENNPGEVDYYVAYTATINVGFDLDEVKITKDDDDNVIIVSLPEVELFDPKVKIEDLDYIVVGSSVETETISADAYKICIADVSERARGKEEIYKYARENGERLIRGLLTPFVDNLDEEYTIKFEWRDTK